MKHNFKELVVWRRVRAFVKQIYELTRNFPSEERYGMVQQIRRAATSVSLNIIEGSGRSTERQFGNFLDIAYGSAKETQGVLIHCMDLGYINSNQLNTLENETIEIQKMIYALRRKVLLNDPRGH